MDLLYNKWIYSIFFTILFLCLSSSFAYSITNKIFKNTLYKKCPTIFGIIIHSIILLFLVRITIFKNFKEGSQQNIEDSELTLQVFDEDPHGDWKDTWVDVDPPSDRNHTHKIVDKYGNSYGIVGDSIEWGRKKKNHYHLFFFNGKEIVTGDHRNAPLKLIKFNDKKWNKNNHKHKNHEINQEVKEIIKNSDEFQTNQILDGPIKSSMNNLNNLVGSVVKQNKTEIDRAKNDIDNINDLLKISRT